MTNELIILFILFVLNGWAQETNEKLLFSFSAEKSKPLELKLDTVNNVMIYRFGKTNEIELEVKDDLNDTTPTFTYSYYLRGGGIDNLGLDLNYVTFTNKGFKYIIYSEYLAEEGSTSTGVRVQNVDKGDTYDIEGVANTVKGSLVSPFRWDELIPTVDME